MFSYILFDLDGTLTDPKEGITKSVQYALKSFNIEVESLDELTHFIGPPLREQFQDTYRLTYEESVKAVEKYRERFRTKGLYENKLYEGIPELLKELKNTGKKLGIASSKPEVFVKEILRYFELEQYFDVIAGSELDGRRTDKSEVVELALKEIGAWERRKEAVLAGDRMHDIHGAAKQGISSVGVSFGYGGRKELEEAGADYIVDTVEGLAEYLKKGGSF